MKYFHSPDNLSAIIRLQENGIKNSVEKKRTNPLTFGTPALLNTCFFLLFTTQIYSCHVLLLLFTVLMPTILYTKQITTYIYLVAIVDCTQRYYNKKNENVWQGYYIALST